MSVTITKRGKNSWQLKYDLPRDNGKRRQRYATVTGTNKDAQRRLRELLSSVDAGTHVDHTRMTVGEYLCSWLDGAHAQSPKTLERYRELGKFQIAPHLGGIGLQRLQPEHLQRWHKRLVESGLAARTVGHAHKLLHHVLADAVKNGLAARTVGHAHKLLHHVLADAVKNGTLSRNATEICRPPRISRIPSAARGSALSSLRDCRASLSTRFGTLTPAC